MLQPQEMSKVELVVPERVILPVTEVLAASGVFHPIPAERLGSDATAAPRYGENWVEQATAYTTLEQRILAIMQTLSVAQGPPPSEIPQLIKLEEAQSDVEGLESETQAYIRELQDEQHRLEELQRHLSQLELITDLNVDLDALRKLRYVVVVMGMMPAVNIERLQSSLNHMPAVLITLRRDALTATVLLIGTQRDADVINRAARSAYLNPLKLPETYSGTPAEVIVALQAEIGRVQQHAAEHQADIERLQETHVDHLRRLLWRVRTSRKLPETISRYRRLHFTYLVSGWVPTSIVSTLRQEVRKFSDKIVFEARRAYRYTEPNTPVALKNPAPLKGFQGLVTNYGYPRYSEIDPTLILALTFPLVFGFMFGDVGHGLLLILLGVILSLRLIRSLRGLASLGSVVIACGIASSVFGFIYGSIFGSEEVIGALWLRPFERIMDILIVAVIVGIGLLSVGIICGIVNAALSRRWGRMFFDRNGLIGLLFYWSLLGLVACVAKLLPIPPTVFAFPIVILGSALAFAEVLGHLLEGHPPFAEQKLGTYLMQAPFELFETFIGLFSNTMSYVRMGAFAVAHGALSMVVFQIAAQVGSTHSIGYWIIVALGNLFIVGYEGLIVSIQTLRLEYYEFFNKFFAAGGMQYTPLTLIPGEK